MDNGTFHRAVHDSPPALTRERPPLLRAAHSLKNSAANVGATMLSRRCFAMEEKARARDANETSQLLSEIETEFMIAKQAIIRLRKEES